MTLCQSDGKSWRFHGEAERAIPAPGWGAGGQDRERPTNLEALLQRQEGSFLPWWHGEDISDPETGMAFSSTGSSCEVASFHWTN